MGPVTPPPLPAAFYAHDDVFAIARALLGKALWTRAADGALTAGRIVETEAYAGEKDRASHAFGGRRTKRTEVMFGPAGHAYVYLVYGMHQLFNVVTGPAGLPHAVLIRATEPLYGLDTQLVRRQLETPSPRISAGPGLLSQALGITVADTGTSLQGPRIWLADGPAICSTGILATPRVGVAYAKEDALLPYRFRIKGNRYTSPAK